MNVETSLEPPVFEDEDGEAERFTVTWAARPLGAS